MISYLDNVCTQGFSLFLSYFNWNAIITMSYIDLDKETNNSQTPYTSLKLTDEQRKKICSIICSPEPEKALRNLEKKNGGVRMILYLNYLVQNYPSIDDNVGKMSIVICNPERFLKRPYLTDEEVEDILDDQTLPSQIQEVKNLFKKIKEICYLYHSLVEVYNKNDCDCCDKKTNMYYVYDHFHSVSIEATKECFYEHIVPKHINDIANAILENVKDIFKSEKWVILGKNLVTKNIAEKISYKKRNELENLHQICQACLAQLCKNHPKVNKLFENDEMIKSFKGDFNWSLENQIKEFEKIAQEAMKETLAMKVAYRWLSILQENNKQEKN